MSKIIVLFLIGCVTVWPQTRIDLRNQSKAVDFQSSDYTKPLKTGQALPSTCASGELFFLSTAVAGQNVYGCTSTNTWTLQSGSGSGALTIKNNNTTVGSRGVLNMAPGMGVVNAITDTGTQITIQQMADTAVMLTRAGHQAGQTLLCASGSNSSSAYSCSMSPTLTSYQLGSVLHWIPDVSGSGGSISLNVDTLGIRPIKLSDGVSDPLTRDVIAGRMYTLWFDGASFRILTPPEAITSSNTPPTCSSSNRGRIWHVFGNAGVKDQVSVCAKDAADSYAWRALY